MRGPLMHQMYMSWRYSVALTAQSQIIVVACSTFFCYTSQGSKYVDEY